MRYSRAADPSSYSVWGVPSKYWLSFFTAWAKCSPPGWITARISMMMLSRMALRSSGVRRAASALDVEPVPEVPLRVSSGIEYLPFASEVLPGGE